MGFVPMYSIMSPSSALLNSDASPFLFVHKLILLQVSRQLFWEDHVSVCIYYKMRMVIMMMFRELGEVDDRL